MKKVCTTSFSKLCEAPHSAKTPLLRSLTCHYRRCPQLLLWPLGSQAGVEVPAFAVAERGHRTRNKGALTGAGRLLAPESDSPQRFSQAHAHRPTACPAVLLPFLKRAQLYSCLSSQFFLHRPLPSLASKPHFHTSLGTDLFTDY